MHTIIEVPRTTLEVVAAVLLPPPIERKLRHLLDLRNHRPLTREESESLQTLVDLNELLSPLRAEALRLSDHPSE